MKKTQTEELVLDIIQEQGIATVRASVRYLFTYGAKALQGDNTGRRARYATEYAKLQASGQAPAQSLKQGMRIIDTAELLAEVKYDDLIRALKRAKVV